MKIISDGKTKTLYDYGDDQVLIVFKDDVTGTDDGIDPGGNVVVGTVQGKGRRALNQSVYFFQLLESHGIPTHFVSVDKTTPGLIAKKARWNGLEFIVRFKAYGSFLRRFGAFVEEGADLPGLVEISVKDDERGDPFINDDAVDALGMMALEDVLAVKALVAKAAHIVRDDLARQGVDLLDMKFECGEVDGRFVIIDDISTDNMRVTPEGRLNIPQSMPSNDD